MKKASLTVRKLRELRLLSKSPLVIIEEVIEIGFLELPIPYSFDAFSEYNGENKVFKLKLKKLYNLMKGNRYHLFERDRLKDFIRLIHKYYRKGYEWEVQFNINDTGEGFIEIDYIRLYKVKPIIYRHRKRNYRTFKHLKHGINVHQYFRRKHYG